MKHQNMVIGSAVMLSVCPRDQGTARKAGRFQRFLGGDVSNSALAFKFYSFDVYLCALVFNFKPICFKKFFSEWV